MKLLRHGPVGAEKPGMLHSDGTVRDLTGVVADIGGDVLSDAGIAALRAVDAGALPVVSGARLGPCVAGTGKFNTGQPFTVNTVFDINFDGNLTDRLNNTQGITITGDRRQPLTLTATNTNSLLAPFGQDGQVGRNSFRAGSILDLDMSLSRRFRFTEYHNLQFRVDFFNFINRTNFGIPVRFLEAPGFGRANDTVTPGRRIQFGLKFNF